MLRIGGSIIQKEALDLLKARKVNIKMINNFSLQFDKDYGINKRTGWSICINGSFMSQLEKYLVVAIWKAFYCYMFVIDKEYR